MKNLFKSMMLVAVAAMGFTACSNDKTEDVAPDMEQKMVTMTITADNDTRTFLTEGDGIVTFGWSAEGEALQVIEVADAAKSLKTTSGYTLNEGKAAFTVSFTENTEAENFTYYAVYPAANYVDSSNTDYEKFKVELPAAQTYTAGSYDVNADLMIAKPVSATAQPTELNMQFSRLVALAKMTLKGMPEDKNITSLTFTATGKSLAGRAYVNLNTAEVSEYGYSGQSEEAITMTIDEAAAINNDAVYFTSFPVELVEGDTFEVKAVTADKYTYTKSVTLGEGKTLAFTVGNLSTFSVNMATADVVAPGKEFVLLDDVSKLHIGDEIIIASAATDGARYAISTTQSNNNRPHVAVTVEGGKITAVEGVAVLTVGKEGDNFTLYDPNGSTGAGYLYAASSSSNYLRTQSPNDSNGEWAISIEATSKAATIKAQGTNTRNLLRYNSSSSLFSCYSSGQAAVYIYLNDVNTSDPVVPVINAETAVTLECTESEGTVTITTENVAGDVTSTLGEEYDWFDAEIDADGNLYYYAMANETEASRTATVTLSAEGAADVVVTFTQKAPAAVVEKISVAEFIANADTETYYELTGVVSNVANTTYGNFDLTDENGDTIYVYGLYSTDGATDMYWATSGVKAGDVITVQGQYLYYEKTSTHEVVNARYISHYGVTATAATDTIDAAGGALTITVASVGTLPAAVTATLTDGAEYASLSYADNTATVTFEENTGDEARSATVTFTCGLISKTVTLEQKAAGAALETVVTMDIFANKGTTGTQTISWTSGDVTVTNNQASSSTAIRTSDSDHYRVYKSSQLVISVAEGTISKIKITCPTGSSSGTTYVETMMSSFNSAGYTATKEGQIVTVTGSASSFAMTASLQTRLSKVEVTYTK